MRYAAAPLALAALAAAKPMPQGVTSAITPSASAPAGCSSSYSGNFQIQVVNVTSSASSKAKRQTSADGTLVMTLADGVLTDSQGRTGYIAANSQFQFDKPAQTGAIYTAGWSVCSNNSLAIGDSAIFYQCLSGTFYNLYEENTAAQCSQVYIDVIGAGSGSSAAATQSSDGQPAVTTAAAASQLSDGQVTASPVSSPAVSQISDGQIQATTGTVAPVSQISDGQIQASSAAAPVSQLSDGQPQAPTSAAATTAAPVSQISDGQIQATTGAPVTQISDGQIQASTAAAPVTQISDGQIQAPAGTAPTVGGATGNATVASPTASVQAYTGAAAPTAIRGEFFGLAAGILAVAML